MSDDILGDMLARTSGEGSRKPKGGIGDVLGRAVSSGRGPSSVPPQTDAARLAGLDVAAWRAVLRYLPADHVPPLLAALPVAAAERLVMAHDAEGQAWIASQTSLIEGATAAQQAAALAKAEAVVARLRDDDRLSVPAPAAPASAAPNRVAPVVGGLGFEAMVARPQAATADAVDTLTDTLAALVEAARGQDSAALRALADQLDHPVLVAGLERIAAGDDVHALREALHHAEQNWLATQERQLVQMREALLTIRFGENAAAFRQRLR